MCADHEAALTVAPASSSDVAEVLRPEQGAIPGDADATVEHSDDGTVRVEVAAPDIGSLRAGMAGWTALLDVATQALDAS